MLHDLVAVLEREVGMDSGVFSTLAYLERATPAHRVRMSELQRLLHPRYSQPGFSRLISRMEAEGLVAREPDPDDGRAVQIVTTRAGRTRYRRASEVYTPEVQRLVGRFLSPDQCHALTTLLRVEPFPGPSDGARDGRPGAPLTQDLRP